MKCRECPYSLACTAGRIADIFSVFALCPACERLYGLLDLTVGDRQEQIITDPAFADQYNMEYVGVFNPAPRYMVVALRCEKRQLSSAHKRKWRGLPTRESQYTQAWPWSDPRGLVESMMVRACPECTTWPDHYIIEDLDEKTKYELEKERSTPAFRLRGSRNDDR